MASTSLHVIQGSRSSDAFQAAGQKAAAALVHYESAPQPEVVQQGQEPQQLLAALGCSDTDNWQPQNCEAYDEDFQVVHALPDCSIAVGSLPFAAYAFAFSAFCLLCLLGFALSAFCLLYRLPSLPHQAHVCLFTLTSTGTCLFANMRNVVVILT